MAEKFFAGKFWQKNFGGKILVENIFLPGKILAEKNFLPGKLWRDNFWREKKFFGKILAEKYLAGKFWQKNFMAGENFGRKK